MSDKNFTSPAYHIIAVPFEKIVPNTYNPNRIAPPEMKLLYDSIREDGYTMPIVCYYTKAKDLYVIVDGFHRHRNSYKKNKCLHDVWMYDMIQTCQ